jgi:hypothetical protein
MATLYFGGNTDGSIPPAPSTSDPANFASEASAFLAWLAGETAVTITDQGQALLDDTDASAQRTTLGLGSIATQAADSVNIDGGSIDGTAIGQSTPDAAEFTDLATGTIAVGRVTPFSPVDIENDALISSGDVADDRRGTIHMQNVGGTPSDGAMATGISFSGVNTRRRRALIASYQDGVDGDPTGLKFFTYGSTASGSDLVSERVTIDSSGRVGFGKVPEVQIDVTSGAATSNLAHFNHTSASYTGDLIAARIDRAASTSYEFFVAYSNIAVSADKEFSFRGDGNAFADGSFTGGGADYAEYFEWALAHLDWLKEWKRQRKTAAGISVVLDAVAAEEVLSSTELRAKVEARVGGDQAAVDAVLARIATGKVHSYLYMFCDESGKARLPGFKLRPATWLDDPEDIIGVISANPSVVGDGDMDRWKGKYIRDAFGAYVMEDYEALIWTEVVTETETVQEPATETQERTREVIEVVDGQAVRKTVTETVQVPLFDELPLVDENGNPVMQQVQFGMTDPMLDEDGNEVEPAQPIYVSQQVFHREPRMVEVHKETTREIEHSYAADEVPDGVAVPADAERVTQKRRKLNPDYDPSLEYTPRADRSEWDTVGLMGKLRVLKGQPVGARWIKMRDISDEVEEWLVR